MKTSASHNKALDAYLQLAAGLSANSKLDLIASLSASLKTEAAIPNRRALFARAFGAFDSEQSAEEIIAEVRASRTFTRQIEAF